MLLSGEKDAVFLLLF